MLSDYYYLQGRPEFEPAEPFPGLEKRRFFRASPCLRWRDSQERVRPPLWRFPPEMTRPRASKYE